MVILISEDAEITKSHKLTKSIFCRQKRTGLSSQFSKISITGEQLVDGLLLGIVTEFVLKGSLNRPATVYQLSEYEQQLKQHNSLLTE